MVRARGGGGVGPFVEALLRLVFFLRQARVDESQIRGAEVIFPKFANIDNRTLRDSVFSAPPRELARS